MSALERHEERLLTSYLLDLRLTLARLVDFIKFNLSLVDLSLDLELERPLFARNPECLPKFRHPCHQLSEEMLRAEGREKAALLPTSRIVLRQLKADDLAGGVLCLGANFTLCDVDLAIESEITARGSANILAFTLLFLSVFLGFLLVGLMARGKLSPDSFVASDITGSQPFLTNDVCHVEAHVGLDLEHASNQGHELLRVEACRFQVNVCLPKSIGPVLDEKFVKLIVRIGRREGRTTRVKDEQNDGKGKQVND